MVVAAGPAGVRRGSAARPGSAWGAGRSGAGRMRSAAELIRRTGRPGRERGRTHAAGVGRNDWAARARLFRGTDARATRSGRGPAPSFQRPALGKNAPGCGPGGHCARPARSGPDAARSAADPVTARLSRRSSANSRRAGRPRASQRPPTTPLTAGRRTATRDGPMNQGRGRLRPARPGVRRTASPSWRASAATRVPVGEPDTRALGNARGQDVRRIGCKYRRTQTDAVGRGQQLRATGLRGLQHNGFQGESGHCKPPADVGGSRWLPRVDLGSHLKRGS